MQTVNVNPTIESSMKMVEGLITGKMPIPV